MSQLHVLFEHASGLAIFRTTEYEEIGIFIPQVKKSVSDISKFRGIVHLVSFQPFQSQKEALLNMKIISSGQLSTDLQLFLENNVPRSKKSKQPVVLGVHDPNLASEIAEKLNIKCNTSGIVKEILRGVRFHFNKLVKGFKTAESANKAQLALAHKYSRERVNFDATRQDSMIIQSHALIDELEKDVRILSKRIRGWYSFHFPELFTLVDGNVEMFVKCIKVIGDRKKMPDNVEEELNDLFGDSSKVEAILQAAHSSMGMEISEVDLENMKMFCDRVLSLIRKAQNSESYLKAKMNVTAPCVSSLVGELVGSRLISRAGGLTGLAKLPASTVQILGADKKLFRAVKGKEKADSCGFISKSAFMGRAGKSKKGHLARILANKCSLAARVDCFSKTPKVKFGSQLVQEVERIVKLHKHFRKDIIQSVNGTPNTNGNSGNRRKRSRGKKKKHLKVHKVSSLSNGSLLTTAEDAGVQDNVLNTVSNPTRQSDIKEVPDSEEKGESLNLNIPDSMEVQSPHKKRKSPAVEPSITEDMDAEVSERQESVMEPTIQLRKSKRLSKRKSIKT